MSAKLRRCLRLFRTFQARGQLANRDVQQLNDCDEQTALRDLNSLMDAGVPLERRGQGAATHYVLPDQAQRDGVSFSIGDLMSLHFGRKLLSFVEGTLLPKWLDELRDTLEERTNGHLLEQGARFDQRLVYLSEPFRPYGAHDDVLNTVITALLSDKTLRARYASRKGVSDWLIEPLALVIYRRALYLLARFPGSDQVLRLSVERFRSAETGQPFDYPDDFDPEAEVHRAYGIFDTGAESEEVRLRFAPEVADLVRARKWHPTERFEERPDGAVDLIMNTHGPELARMALEWGDKVEVVSPPAIRERVIREMRAALRRYGVDCEAAD